LLREVPRIYFAAMASDVEKVEQLALGLSEEDRAQLAASLLDSLPGILSDQDDGVAEALRRDAELDAHPERAISLEELDTFIRSRRK
jgi:putative addiction module component (TIGR02574 family)